MQRMLSLSEAYNKSVQEESTLTAEQLKTRHVGKQGESGLCAHHHESCDADLLTDALH